MEVSSVTYYGWKDGLKTAEKRITFDYPQGNDVTIVENRSYTVAVYDSKGAVESVNNKGNVIDKLV